MSVEGFLLVKAAMGAERKLHAAVMAVPEVHSTDLLFGSWDLIAHYEVADREAGEALVGRIEGLSEVESIRHHPATRFSS